MLPAKRIAPLRSTARLPLSLPLRGAQTPIRQPRRHATTGPQKPGMGIKEEGTAKTYNKDGTNPNKNILYLGLGALGLGGVYAMFMARPEKVAKQ